MNINLNNCKPGQKLKTRDGRYATYVSKDTHCSYPHNVKIDDEHHERWYCDNGGWYDGKDTYAQDIVEIIIYMKTNENNIDKNTGMGIYIQDKNNVVFQLHTRNGRFTWLTVYNKNWEWPTDIDACNTFGSVSDAIYAVVNPDSGAFLVMPKNVTKTEYVKCSKI